MHISAVQKLRIHMMLLSLGVLVLTLGFNMLLSVSTLDALATDSILSGYRSGGEHFTRSLERGMRFGKPLNSYAGMGEMLVDLQGSVPGIARVEVMDAQGTLLYARPVSQATQGGQLRPDDLRRMKEFHDVPEKALLKTQDGYRLLIPLHHKGLAGWVAMEVAGGQIDAAAHSFLRWSASLALAACVVVGLILTGWLGLLTDTEEARARLHGTLGKLLLILIGGTQLAYSCGTLVLFDSFVKETVRTKTVILAQSVKRDVEYLIHKGVDVTHLKGTEHLLERLVADNKELRGAELTTPDGTVLISAGEIPAAGLSVQRSLDAYWPSRFRQRQPVLLLRLGMDQHFISERILNLAIDLGTSLVISFLLLLELAKVMGLVALRGIASELVPQGAARQQSSAAYTSQVLRAGGFVFFLGYDMGISFIPLLARSLYQPFWGLSEEVVIGLPISAEMVCAGIALLVSGSVAQRYGWRRIFMLGTITASLGLFTGGVASGLPMLIGARGMAGFGFGLVLMAAQLGTLEHANAGSGLASVFAGIFSGSICGSAAGALLAEHMAFESVLLIGGVVILAAVRAVWTGTPASRAPGACGGRELAAVATAETGIGREIPASGSSGTGTACARTSLFAGGMSLLRDPRMHCILLLVGIPAAICLTGFLHYLLPLRLAAANVEQADIGRVFMLYGLCFITAGPLLGKWMDRTADTNVFLVLTGLLSGAALLLAARPADMPGTAAAVVALGLAQCLAAPATMLCVLALRPAQILGREKTASIYRGLERVGQVLGPVIFGVVTVAMEPQQALLLMGGVVCALALVYLTIWRARGTER